MKDQRPATLQDFYNDGLLLVLGANLSGSAEETVTPVLQVVSVQPAGKTIDFLCRNDPGAFTGLLVAAGREEFEPLQKAFGIEIGLLDQAIRTLPLRGRVEKALDLTLAWMNDQWQLHGAMESGKQELKVFVPTQQTGAPQEVTANQAAFVGGLLQGLLTWISSGKFYPIKLKSSDEVIEILFSRDPLD